MSGKLLICRHGESEWNAQGRWTGTTDVHLTEKGFHEGNLLGEAIKDVSLQYAYCSEQIRALETMQRILEVSGNGSVSYERSAAINERDYGDFTGKNKWQVEEEIGAQAFEKLRRGWNVPVPHGETLKMVYDRTIPFYQNTVLPRLLCNQNVLLVAHGNSIRALMKYIESISNEDIEKTEMIFGTVLIYDVSSDGKQTSKEVRKVDTTPPPA